MSEATMSNDLERRRRAKNIAIGLTVAGLCVLFYIITIVKMGVR